MERLIHRYMDGDGEYAILLKFFRLTGRPVTASPPTRTPAWSRRRSGRRYLLKENAMERMISWHAIPTKYLFAHFLNGTSGWRCTVREGRPALKMREPALHT